jgi:two-component system cell cycle sensor histidine kinase/response regulator CckA
VSVATRLAQDLSAVEADRAQIERVILNLAANARDAMPHGGALTLETRNVELEAHGADDLTGPHVLLAVSDTGIGMDEKVRAHLFEPFFTTKPGGEGTGLGLATVFGVVKQSGGGIYVYSERGSGTTFKIYLPAQGRPVAASPPLPREPEPVAGTETVLVVEDDNTVARLAAQILGGQGYLVFIAGNAEEALRQAAELPSLDMLLADVVLPGPSGLEVAAAVTELHPQVRVLYTSGYTDDAVVRHGVIAGTVAFLQKPFTRETLSAAVRGVLDDPAIVFPPKPH